MLKPGGVGSGLLLAWLSQPAPERYQCTTDHDAAGAGAEATADKETKMRSHKKIIEDPGRQSTIV